MMKKKHTNLHLLIPILLLFPSCSWVSLALAQNETIVPVHVGVILDDLQYSFTKDIWLSCIKMAVLDFYATHPHYNTRVVLKTGHCKENVVSAAAAALDLIKNEQVKAIIGPVTSMQTSFVTNLGKQAHVPIISFSATSPSLTSIRNPYFFQFAQSDSSQVKAISAVVKAFGWREVVPIYIDTEYGVRIIPDLTDALHEVNARVPYRSIIPSSATDGQILQELSKLMTMETRVFLVHMTTDLSSRLFVKAKEIGMMSEGYVWLTTTEILNKLQSQNSTVIDSMQGVLGVQTFVPPTPELEELKVRLRQKFHTGNSTVGAELDVFGLWAYDAVFAVAMAIEQEIGTPSSFPFQESNAASRSTTDLEGLPVSPYGPKLLTALSIVRFEGISGNFSVVGGKRISSNFRIVNVSGGRARTLGFWTLKNGLVKTLNSSPGSSKTSSSKFEFGPIRWPGYSLSVPKGWEIPTKGKKLRILVPVKVDFTEFVKVAKDPTTGTTVVTGFSIDVFEAAVKLLPYNLPYELIPFAKPDGTSNGTYNQMCDQVYLGNFDAAVGDTTIRADRSLYVDFTMPYSESGVAMVVPVIDKHVLAFWRPWTWHLWLTICFFFVYIGFVVWFLEHRINKEFRGPLLHQVGTSVWFSCSTVVFAHRERVVSNLARFVMIIWLFAVLILTINYTASLSSLYTVEQLQPTVTDIEDLVRNQDNVGYIKNAFSYDLLIQVGFNASKLMRFETMKEIDEALSKRTAKGGIAAFVHGTPKAKLFLAKYCSKYTLITPIFKTDGFAFVFPKRSPLVADVSQAILNMTGGQEILNLEKKWLNKSSCQDSSDAAISSNRRGLGSFWVLFLIAGVTSVVAVVIFVASFIYRHRYVLEDLEQPTDSEPSTWRKIQALFKIFNEKDLDSHTFRRSDRQRDAVTDSPNNFPGALVHHISGHTDQMNSSFIGEQQTSSIVEAPSDVLLPSDTEVVITVQEMHRTNSNTAQE